MRLEASLRTPPPFRRWRPDRKPESCRYDQLAETPAYELEKIFGSGDGA